MSGEKSSGAVKRQSRIHSFFEAKRSKDDNGDSGTLADNCDSGNTSDAPTVNATDTGSAVDETKTHSRSFQPKWQVIYPWVSFSESLNKMTCELCLKTGKHNVFTDGTDNFRTSTLKRHADSADHKLSVQAESLKGHMKIAVKNVLNEKEKAAVQCMKVVLWMVKEALPMQKYPSLMNLLQELGCPFIENLKVGEGCGSGYATYTSVTTANEMVSALASVIRKDLDSKLLRSPFVSILTDESTDITVHKKLTVYATVMDPDTFTATTHFISNVKIEQGTGSAIAERLTNILDEKKVPMAKCMGLGSDGASVMTGLDKGVTGQLLNKNPMMINYHCIAHRLALVSSQAAEKIPAVKDYSETLTSMFYYFKHSSNRNETLKEIQILLEEPTLRMKEVHSVRWLAIYKAVETVYRCLDSLMTFFINQKDAKGQGFAKKISQQNFVGCTYLLMSVLSILSELSLVFQKRNLDISLVQVSVENAISSLKEVCDEKEHRKPNYLDQLQIDVTLNESGKAQFKSNHLLKGRNDIKNIRNNFIQAVIQNLEKRFPNNSIIYAFGVLGMRPVSFLTSDDLEMWGNLKLEQLLEHFGSDKVRVVDGTEVHVKAIIDADNARVEWGKLKKLVVNSGYPRDNMQKLWTLIHTYNSQDFPNLLILASVALTAPIHTSDCERGFSSQNLVKTSLRNQLSNESLDELLLIAIEGSRIEDFRFEDSLKAWRSAKQRKLFQNM